MNPVDLKKERELKRRAANKETILHAAEAVILRSGVRAATMDDIARESQFSKATLYQYFRGKTELVDEIVLHFYDDMRTIVERIRDRELGAAEKLRRLLRSAIEFHDAKENVSRVLMTDEVFFNRMTAFLSRGQEGLSAADKRLCRVTYEKIEALTEVGASVLREGVRNGEFRDMNVDSAMTFIGAVLMGVFHVTVSKLARLGPKEKTDIIMEFVLNGIAAGGPGPLKGESS
jgi:AcrR family transcriptional regulator